METQQLAIYSVNINIKDTLRTTKDKFNLMRDLSTKQKYPLDLLAHHIHLQLLLKIMPFTTKASLIR